MLLSSTVHSNYQHYVFKIPGNRRIWWGICLATAGLVLLLILLAGEKNIFKLTSLYREQKLYSTRLEMIQIENRKLKQQIEELRTSSQALERIARQELGMVRSDEIVYRFVSPSQTQATSQK